LLLVDADLKENAVTMARTKHKIGAALGGTPDEVEAAFYEALQTGDLEKLMGCWADEDDVACIHPGGGRILGVAAIRASFDGLFAKGGSINTRPEQIRRVDSMASAIHHIVERVEVISNEGITHAHVLATNVYFKTPLGWKMVLHHASPGTLGETLELNASNKVLH